MKQPVYKAIARELQRMKYLKENTIMDKESVKKNMDDAIQAIRKMEREALPSDSGFDRGCEIDRDRSSENVIVILAPYHHMDSNGYYCGWSDYTVRVKASLTRDFDLTVSGGKKGDRDYVGDAFAHALDQTWIS